MITCTLEHGSTARLRHAVVHALVVKNDSILLVKRHAKLPEGGKWGFPGGFMDRDETAFQATLRELYEETGWKGRIIALFRINTLPNRPHEDRQNISFDFLVEPVEKTGIPDHESTDTRFIPFSQLPPLSDLAFDHGDSIAKYLQYNKEKFPLPLFD